MADEGARRAVTPGGDAESAALLALYPVALPQVYGYLIARCGKQSVAEDLTSETLLAAVDAIRRRASVTGVVSVPWLVGIARHKLVDHWRRQARDERRLYALASTGSDASDPWEVELDGLRTRAVMSELSPDHRAVLTLRYIDDLPVREIAELMGRSEHATEGLLSRAKDSFRRYYEGHEEEVDGA